MKHKAERPRTVPTPEVAFEKAVPIIRIFDMTRAEEFYLGYLGFSVDWQHRHAADLPLYLQVSRGGLILHLSEHHGDATPGGTTCVFMQGIRAFHDELASKPYRFMRPSVMTMGNRLEMIVTDPFGSRLRFMESIRDGSGSDA